MNATISYKHLNAVLLIVIGLFSVINGSISKYLIINNNLNPLALTGLRFFFSMIFAVIFSVFFKKTSAIYDIFKLRHIARNILTIGAFLVITFVSKYCTIVQLDLVNYLVPVCLTIISTVFLRETFPIFTLMILLACSAIYMWSYGANVLLPLLLCATLFALSELLIKKTMGKDSVFTLLISIGVFSSILLSPYYLTLLPTMSFPLFLQYTLLGLGDVIIVFLIKLRSDYCIFGDFMPLRYSSMIFSFLVDKFFFCSDVVNIYCISSLVITVVLSIMYEYLKKK